MEAVLKVAIPDPRPSLLRFECEHQQPDFATKDDEREIYTICQI